MAYRDVTLCNLVYRYKVSEEFAASIFMVEEVSHEDGGSRFL
jgi:hypothetical protein